MKVRSWLWFAWYWCMSTPARWRRWWVGKDTSDRFDGVLHVSALNDGNDYEQFTYTLAIFSTRPIWRGGYWYDARRDQEVWRYRHLQGFTQAHIAAMEAHENLSRRAGRRVQLRVLYEQLPDEPEMPAVPAEGSSR